MLPEGEYSLDWDASGLENGLYFLQFRMGDKLAVRKIIKEK